ncbi:hypothetical protein DPMN_034368 [Dreissena polymorpha]|uniref:Uncharacterized protein n=1 Tax=Dreissena polymorpha TaxID=45954 RepID=A0A9D4M7E3_DREPO|nr:hypothetical protein DPMN_034368 [Dreissena polymorpha]
MTTALLGIFFSASWNKTGCVKLLVMYSTENVCPPGVSQSDSGNDVLIQYLGRSLTGIIL